MSGLPVLAQNSKRPRKHRVLRNAVIPSSLHRDRHGRTPMSSASSDRSAANVSITSSSSTSVTCAVCCRHTLSITTEAGHISRSPRSLNCLRRLNLRSRFAVEGRRGLQLPRTSAMVAQSQQRTTLHSNHRQSSVEVFVGNPVPWPEGLLSKDSSAQAFESGLSAS